MTEPSQVALERFNLLDTNVKIATISYSGLRKTSWAIYGHPASKAMQARSGGWTRVAVRDTEHEIRTFCAEWGLNIIEDEA